MPGLCIGVFWHSSCVICSASNAASAHTHACHNRHFLDEADALADRVAILREGRLAASGPALALKARYCDGCASPQRMVRLQTCARWCQMSCSSTSQEIV